jgi:hypothetical protein
MVDCILAAVPYLQCAVSSYKYYSDFKIFDQIIKKVNQN